MVKVLTGRELCACINATIVEESTPPDKKAPITFVVIPEYVARSWWERILYNQSAKRLRTVLLGRPHTVVVNVPYRREAPDLSSLKAGGGDPHGPPRSTDDGIPDPSTRGDLDRWARSRVHDTVRRVTDPAESPSVVTVYVLNSTRPSNTSGGPTPVEPRVRPL